MESVERPAGAVDIDELAAQVMEFASSHQLAVVPATPLPNPASGLLVLLGNKDLSAGGFCELAQAAGARMLYVQTVRFVAESAPEFLSETCDQGASNRAMSDRLTALRQEAKRFEGRPCQLELAFAVGRILHCWAVAAGWYDNLIDRLADLREAG
jgi:hypothetical protein